MDAPLSDAELAEAARRDPAAFDRLYRRYLPAVYRYVYARVGSAADAEDVTSAIFLDVLTSLRHYREQGLFTAWLFTIAQRQVGAHHRRRRRDDARRAEPHADAADAGVQSIDALPSADSQKHVLRLEQADLLARAVAGLGDEQREALSLRFYGGLKVSEIAEVMNKGESAVKMILHRSLNQLKAGLLLTEDRAPEDRDAP